MDEYDLGRLSDVEFEALCKDLFEEILGVRLEIFARGADSGIDLRGRDADGGLVVVQCKHWWRSEGSELAHHVERDERPKVERLAPARYVLATSCDLTVKAKDRLYAALQPFAHAPTDVYGVKEIAAELRKRPHVVHRHPALWFHSAEALSAVTQKHLFERNRDLADDIARTLRVYVPGHTFPEALRLLDDEHACLISGLPDLGKTALAHALAATYAARHYQVVAVSEDTLDLDVLWSDDRPQLFLYDDFLVRSRRERHRHNATPRLLQLLQRVAEAPDKRLVLTTREYVLAQARQDDERLHRAGLDAVTCHVRRDEYDEDMRAQIVRNHVDASALPAETKAAVLAPDTLARLAGHPAFNPYQLAGALRAAARDLVPADRFADRLLSYFDDPAGVWGHIVEEQLGDAEVDLLAVLFSFGEPAWLRWVERAWVALRRHDGRPADTRLFRRALSTLRGTMVESRRPDGAEGDPDLALYDASVAGFAASYFTGRPDVLAALLESAPCFEQVEALFDAVSPPRGPVPRVVVALREPLLAALRRTVGAETCRPWDGSPFYRAAAVADVAAALDDDAARALLRDVLRDLDVTFDDFFDDRDGVGLAFLVEAMLDDARSFDDELGALLLPPIRTVEAGDVEGVFALAEFVVHHPLLPRRVRGAASDAIRAALARALADDPPNRTDVLTLADAAVRLGLDLPEIPGLPTDS